MPERKAAGFASWYELFPRSQSGDPDRHGTFDDVIAPAAGHPRHGLRRALFPADPSDRPDQPQGPQQQPEGRRRTIPAAPMRSAPTRAGTTPSIPSSARSRISGGSSQRRAEHGLEIALDFAIQCSPDHPWLKQHPDWFDWRPDGTIKYAENPPKKYEDIVNVDFYAAGAVPALWVALRDVVLLWVEQGVQAVPRRQPAHQAVPVLGMADRRRSGASIPDAIFLAEAFTRPKMMYRLAKIGFSQSYTYFTWRNTKAELTEYLTELTAGTAARLLPPALLRQHAGHQPGLPAELRPRPAFLIRAALAATLSGLWGVYNGFELCEGRRRCRARKEYLDSEKYEIRAWDWDRPGNIIAEITRLNRIRRANPALQTHLGLTLPQRLRTTASSIYRQGDAGAATTSSWSPSTSIPHQRAGARYRGAAVGVGPAGPRRARGRGSGARAPRSPGHGKIQHIRLDPGRTALSRSGALAAH